MISKLFFLLFKLSQVKGKKGNDFQTFLFLNYTKEMEIELISKLFSIFSTKQRASKLFLLLN